MAAADGGDGHANGAKADAAPEGAAAAALASLPTPARSLLSERGRPGASAERRGLWRIYSATVLPHGGAQDSTPPEQALADLSRMLREEKGGRSSADSQGARQACSPAGGAAPEGVVVALGPPESPGPCSLAGSDDATPQSATSIASLAVAGAGFCTEARASAEAPEVTRARQRAARAKENAVKAAAQRRAAAEQAAAAEATGATLLGEREEAGGGKRASPDGAPIPPTKRRITCKTAPGAAGAAPAPPPTEAPAEAASAPVARPEPLPKGAIVPLPPMVPWSSSPAAAERRARRVARTRVRVAVAEPE